MEHVESMGGLPLSLVTEVPLFELDASAPDDLLPQLRAYRRRDPESVLPKGLVSELAASTRPVSNQISVRLHLAALQGALAYLTNEKRFQQGAASNS